MDRIGTMLFCTLLACALAGCGGSHSGDEAAAPAAVSPTPSEAASPQAASPQAGGGDFDLKPADGVTILHRIEYPATSLSEPGLASAFGSAPQAMTSISCSVAGRTGSVTLYRFADAAAAARALATADARPGNRKATFRAHDRTVIGVDGAATKELLALVDRQLAGR